MIMCKYRLGLLGWPLSHSLSPVMQRAALDAYGLTDWIYELIPTPPDELAQAWPSIQSHYFGCNVTIPHKQTIAAWVQSDPLANAVGAVNTIVFQENDLPLGSNTDILGLMGDLACHGIDLRQKRVVILGAGGASRAAVYLLVYLGCKIMLINRTLARSKEIQSKYPEAVILGKFEDVEDWQPQAMINCTSVGMWPYIEDCPWPDSLAFPRGVLAYDMIYRPMQTAFLKKAEAAHGTGISGIGMLVHQGAAAFTIWTKKPAPFEIMFKAVQNSLANS